MQEVPFHVMQINENNRKTEYIYLKAYVCNLTNVNNK